MEVGKIADSDEKHEEEEENKSNLMNHSFCPPSNRRTFQFFNNNKEYPSTIKCWNREDVDDTEIDRKKRCELEEVCDTEITHLFGQIDNPYWSGNINWRSSFLSENSSNHFSKCLQNGNTGGCRKVQRYQWHSKE